MSKKILMHTCCAPCSTYVIKKLREEGYDDITSYWYNPNIQPFDEYKHRLETLKEYTKMVNVPLLIHDHYNLNEFLQAVANYNGIRCEYCYRMRLEMSVKFAKENGYDCFTTTLLVSPYQKHDLLKKVCEDLSREYDIEFVYYDFREGYYEGQQMAKDAGLYRHKITSLSAIFKYFCMIYTPNESSNNNKHEHQRTLQALQRASIHHDRQP